ncbi:hypothetical protein OROMI_000491 [Orobanche minor]
MTPFEAVYGRPPPLLVPFLPGEIRVQAVAEELQARNEILTRLKAHLERASQRMVREANKHRRELEFAVGDKLAPRFFGPFEVIERIGKVAYRLQLPAESRIHPVFHVSLLKLAVGTGVLTASLPEGLSDGFLFMPGDILRHRWVRRNNVNVEQVLVSWQGLEMDENSWEDVEVLKGQLPEHSSLVDKAVPVEAGVDTTQPIKLYTRRKKAIADVG